MQLEKNINILLLGSSKGLGKVLYELFKKNKYEVVGVSRSDSEQTDFICDLSDKNQVLKLIKDISITTIPQHIIFNAGKGSSNKETLEERREELMNHNFYTSKHFVEEIKVDPLWTDNVKGLTFINSICALENFKCSEEYSESKFELLKYSRGLSKDFLKYGIRVNSILPGNIMHQNSVWHKKFKNEMEEKIFLKNTMPNGDWIYPEDVFGSIKYLIQNKNVVGTEIILDGGQNLFSPD